MSLPTKSPNSQIRAIAVGLFAALIIAAGIYIGSHRLEHFDHALFWYALASILAAYAVGYRFTLWASRPPSEMYFKRALQLLLRSGPTYKPSPACHAVSKRRRVLENRAEGASPIHHSPFTIHSSLATAAASNFGAQNLIRKRSYYRWIMHLCLSGGCSLAFAVTFPLVFGWIHFTTAPDDAEIYNVVAFGLTIDTFSIYSVKAFLAFNALNISAAFVMVGLTMAGYRRLTDAGERATQTFYEDILPLIIIAFVTVTGMALTVSYHFFGGIGHHSIVWIHMVCVIALLFYIPFGKLFHMVQRICSLCVSMYKKAGANEEQATCLVTGQEYAPKRHVEDLKIVLDELGYNYRFTDKDGNEVHYQDISPQGRRRLIALNQGKILKR